MAHRHKRLVVVMPGTGHVPHGMHKDRDIQEGTMTASGKTQLGTKSVARSMVWMEAIVTMPVVQVVVVVDPEMRIVALVVSQDRIVAKQPRLKVQVAVNMVVPVTRVIEITKVVMAVPGPHEHVKTDRVQVHNAVGPVDKDRAGYHGG